MKPAIFLDRDGVIIENRANYVRSWPDVEFFPQALKALAKINQLPITIVAVTNQSGVGRGLIPLETAQTINQRVVEEVHRAGGRIDQVFMCPHAPRDNCSCRKPEPGLLLQAESALDIDLARSIMIGDALTDVKAGQAAGVKDAILLRTGRGYEQELLPEAKTMPSFLTYDNLLQALTDYFKLF